MVFASKMIGLHTEYIIISMMYWGNAKRTQPKSEQTMRTNTQYNAPIYDWSSMRKGNRAHKQQRHTIKTTTEEGGGETLPV